MWIRSIALENVCGYRQAFFEFDRRLNMLFGPNGCGKSTMLDVCQIVASPMAYYGRDTSMLFRKMVFHEDYNPSYDSFEPSPNGMRVEAVFDVDGEEKKVEVCVSPDLIGQINETQRSYNVRINKLKDRNANMDAAKLQNERDTKIFELGRKMGVVRNDLGRDNKRYALYTDADHPSKMQSFQLLNTPAVVEPFLDMARSVYGYDCYLDKQVSEKGLTFYTDFILLKDDDGPDFEHVKVHYRRMSAGERKIATLLRQMYMPDNRENHDIYLIDNVEMHVYFRRHAVMMDKMQEHLKDKQIIATTHSGEIIRHLDDKHLFDIKEVRRQGLVL